MKYYTPLFIVLVQFVMPIASALPQQIMLDSSIHPSVERVVDRYYEKVKSRLEPRFRFADVEWPPKRVSLVAFKEQKRMEIWAEKDGQWVFVHDYDIRGISGIAGPKLREGDRQVPEGFYRILWLNPASNFHLSLKLDYPNVQDRKQARREGRSGLGGDIFIHGESASRGCLAMGNNAIEDLFVLTALAGKENVSVLISPRDFRVEPLGLATNMDSENREWVLNLTRDIANELEKYPRDR